MSQPIDYQSSFKPPSEYEHAYEQERGRWLRRRLLWYSGTSLALGALVSLPTLLTFNENAVVWDFVTLFASSIGAAAVLMLAWRCKPQAQRILRIAFVFYVLSSLFSIGYTYLTFDRQSSAFEAGLNQGFEQGTQAKNQREQRASTRPAATTPSTQPSLIEGSLDRYDDPVTINVGNTRIRTSAGTIRNNAVHGMIYFGLLMSFLFNHLVVCLFIPWTTRESLRPAGIIAGSAVAVVAIHVLFGLSVWWLLLVFMALLPLAFAPGTLVCWWRYSRFNRHFRLKFESGRYREMQHELSSARQVHDANLPSPRLEGPVRLHYVYEPMRQIGGDLLMIHPPDKSLPPQFVILFDVTGHGVAAALSVNRIVGEIERLLAEKPDESVEYLARALNRYVHLTLAKHHLYVSALLFHVDAAASKVRCVNAGHPTAYHVRTGSREVNPIESTTMLLGVVGDSDFESESVTLPLDAGDAVVGYTDGASEASDPDERMLGIAGVRAAISAATRQSADPGFWPSLVSTHVIHHRRTPPQDDTIIFALWRV